MPRPFIALSIKEIKELLRDRRILLGMIVVPLLMFPIMGQAIRTSMESVEESLQEINLVVIDLDEGSEAAGLISFLKTYPGIKVNMSENVDEAISEAESGVNNILVIPVGFSRNLTEGRAGQLEVYTILDSLTISAGVQSSTIESLINIYRRSITINEIRAHMPDRDPESILDPVTLSYVTYIKDHSMNIRPDTLTQVYMTQSIMMPLVVMIILIFAMQIAATSMAMEKESKTLETILTLPVSRLSILSSKLAGSIFVSAVAAGAYMIGFSYYLGSYSAMNIGGEGLNIDLASMGLTYTPTAFLLLGLSLFVTLVAGLALAVSIAVFAEDVRGAQSFIGILIIPIIFPTIILMFTDIGSLPTTLQLIIYAIPFSHPIIAAKSALLGDYLTIGLGIIYVAAFTLIVLYLVSKMFTTEKIVTAKLFRRQRPIEQSA